MLTELLQKKIRTETVFSVSVLKVDVIFVKYTLGPKCVVNTVVSRTCGLDFTAETRATSGPMLRLRLSASAQVCHQYNLHGNLQI